MSTRPGSGAPRAAGADRPTPGRGGRRDRTLPGACTPGPSSRCSVCGDDGRLGVVQTLLDGGTVAQVRMEDTGRVEEVALDLVDPVAPGDRLVVHMGFALATVRERDGAAGDAGVADQLGTPDRVGAPDGPAPRGEAGG